MSVYIIGKKPDRCGVCPCFHAENPMYCQAVKAAVQKPRIVRPYAIGWPEWCPIIEVPEPHGRLGDLDALKDKWTHKDLDLFSQGWGWLHDLNQAPTIIPASEEGEK